jgi:hypothetical protein
MRTISATLRAAIFSGAVGLLPSIAFADSGSSGTDTGTEPDHAAAEARSVGENVGDTSTSSPESPAGMPDHATAEARSGGDKINARSETTKGGQDNGVPDHATAERRGAPDSD